MLLAVQYCFYQTMVQHRTRFIQKTLETQCGDTMLRRRVWSKCYYVQYKKWPESLQVAKMQYHGRLEHFD
uniref:Uncharacterized protein n=1 Tax=Anopheles merus TaxID=30066 RepID=A0A182UZ20_ANOME